jgi:geranylgeranyl diphosphate synthase type II
MIGGQVMDVQSEGKMVGREVLYGMHARKTGAMIRVSVTSGALLAGARLDQRTALATYGDHIGLAFQIADDLLNVTGSHIRMGKNTGSDEHRGKATFPALIGIEESRTVLQQLIRQGVADLAGFDEKADPLRLLAKFIMERDR